MSKKFNETRVWLESLMKSIRLHIYFNIYKIILKKITSMKSCFTNKTGLEKSSFSFTICLLHYQGIKDEYMGRDWSLAPCKKKSSGKLDKRHYM